MKIYASNFLAFSTPLLQKANSVERKYMPLNHPSVNPSIHLIRKFQAFVRSYLNVSRSLRLRLPVCSLLTCDHLLRTPKYFHHCSRPKLGASRRRFAAPDKNLPSVLIKWGCTGSSTGAPYLPHVRASEVGKGGRKEKKA